MTRDQRTARSKRLAYVLRHAPESVGLKLDSEGFVGVDELLTALRRSGAALEPDELEEIVRLDSKGRYQLLDGRIRAVQGHSTTQVDRTFPERVPPPQLFHGTASTARNVIEQQGLKPMSRHYVHLSGDLETAKVVGRRHLKGGARLVVYAVDTAAVLAAGGRFLLAENGVWLVSAVARENLSLAYEG